ncbi:MAG: IS30 family transposase [Nitriliruptor sp.]|uniref:IS30 family transposase n=1 Tax=Nitriliruptor sp. TaxID=2448056 RepID=UPI0034A000AD
MPAQPLTLHEREEIRAGIERAEPLTTIAERLGRHRCTISTEVNRNGGRTGYAAVAAQDRADRQRSRPKVPKLAADPGLAAHVTARLEARDSPMTISIELARGVHGITGTVSHECIYQAVYAHGRRGLRRGLHQGLHRRHRCRRRRHPGGQPAKRSPLGSFNLIGARPAVADDRVEVGHLEGDLIVGAYNRLAIATVFDRASRHLWLADFPADHGAEATLGALVEILERIPEALRRTLTWDQGREMARHCQLADLCGIDIYFAEPHSPWQRLADDGHVLLVATDRYIGEGFDCPRLDTLFLTFPISAPQRIVQYVGRILRAHPDKHDVEVHDYLDAHVPMFAAMHRRRLPGYKQLGFSADRPTTPGAPKLPLQRAGTHTRSSSPSSKTTEPTTAAVRAWARATGLDVADRGRLGAEVWQRYREAHG